MKANKSSYDMSFYWSVTNSCNFNCPQCAADRIKLKNKDAPEKIDIPRLQNFLDKHPDKVFKFSLSGGEPLFVENILEATRVLTKKHYVGIISNLVSPRVAELAETIDPTRILYLNASAHMLELNKRNELELFLDNAVLLKKKGFQISITEVAYPFIIDKVDQYRKIFWKRGFNLFFNSFRGEWEKKQYPAAYTKKEINTFGLNQVNDFRYDINYRKGLFCNAGYNTMVIVENGDVWACYSLKKKIGSIYDDIDFRDNLIKCPFDFCTCPFPALEPSLFDLALKETNSKNNRLHLFTNYMKARVRNLIRS